MLRRNTKERALVFEIAGELFHPTAEEIFAASEGRQPRVSKATVYRNLGILEEEGMLKSVVLREGPVRYDARLSPHSHFKCNVCGKLFDFPAVATPVLSEGYDGAEIEGSDVVFYGVCKTCLAKRTKKG